MCSKDLTELPELKELLNRLIVRKHMCSVAVASLLPLLLGYIAYRMVVDLGARLVPQDVFFLIGLFAAIVLAWTLSSVILASAKVNHIAANPLQRFMLGALYRMEHGSTEPFNPKAHFREMALMIAVFNRLFGCQDRCLAELVDVVHVFGHNAGRYARHVGAKAELCLDPMIPVELREAHRAELPDEAIREIDALSDHIELCVQIVDNYNRIKGPPFAEVDVVSVANARIAALRTDANRKRLSLSAALPPSCVVWAHESKLANVIHNLVDNAIKYTPEGGSVSLSVGWEKDDLVIAVTDTGCGVPAEYRERVFDPAFRAPGTAKVEGQGLGLSFVRSIARFYGGTCRCDSNPGSGSTFAVSLPLRKGKRK